MKRLDKFSIKQLRELLSKENSFIFLEHATRHLAIAPSGLANIKTAVKEEVDSSIDKYDPKLKGLVLGFENIQIIPVSDHGNIFYDDCLIHIDIEGDFYVFRPHIGCSLTGTVNKKSLNHLGLLVHSWFNVAVPNTDSTGYWVGNKVQIGQEVTITVTLLNFSGNLPYICGKLQNISDSVANKTHKKKKFQDEDYFVEGSSLLNDDTGALHNEESFECNDSVNVGDSVNEDFHVKNIKEKKKRRAVNVTLNIEVLPSIDNSINEKSYSGVCETESSFQEKIKHNKGKSKRKRDDSFEILSSPLSSNKKIKLETFSPCASPITSKSVSATNRFIHLDKENDSDTDMYPLTQKPKETKSEEKTLEIPSHSSDSDSDDQTIFNENETNPSKGYTDVTVLSDVKPQFTSTPFEKLTPTKSKSLRKKGNLDQNTCLDSPNKKSHDFLTSANRRSLSLKSKRICDNQSIPNVKNPTKSMANSSSESEDISEMLSKQITKIDNKQMLSPKKSSEFQNSDSGLGSDDKKSSPNKILRMSSKAKQTSGVKRKVNDGSDSETNDNAQSSSKGGGSDSKKSSPSKLASVSSKTKLIKQAINVKRKQEDSSSDSETNDNVHSSSKSGVSDNKKSSPSKIASVSSKTKLVKQAINVKRKEEDSSSDSETNDNAQSSSKGGGSDNKKSSPSKIPSVFSKTKLVKQAINVKGKEEDSSSDSDTNDSRESRSIVLGLAGKESYSSKISHVISKLDNQASNFKSKENHSSSDSETNMNGESRNNNTNSDSKQSSSNKISQVSSNTGSVKHTSNVRSDVDDSSSDAETNDNRESRSIGLGSNSTKSLSKIPDMISKSKSFKQAPNSMSKVSDSSSDSETNSNGKSRKNDFGSDGKQSSLNIFAQVSSKTSSSNPSSDVKSKSDDSSSDSETNTNEKPTNNSLGSDRSPNKIAQTKSIKHALNIKAKVSDSHSESDNNAYSHNTVSSSPATYELKKTSSKTTKKLKKNNLKSSSDNKTKSRSKNIGNEDDKDFATDSDSNTKSLNEILQEIMNKTLPSYDINSGSEEKLAENDPKLDCSDSHTNKKSPSKGKAQLKNKFPEKSHSATTDVHMSDSVENKLSSSNVHGDKESTETVQSAITPLKKQKSSRKTKKSNEVSSNLIEKTNEGSHFQAKSKKTNVSKQDSIVAKSSDQLMEMVNKLLGSSEQTSEIEENPRVKSKKTTSKDVKKLDKNGENMDENKNKKKKEKKKKEKKKKEKKKKKDKDDKKKKNEDSIFSIQQQILNSLLKQSE